MRSSLAVLFVLVALTPTASLLYAASPQAVGLKVEPGALFIQNVFLGKLYDVYKESGLRLTVHNESSRTRTYILSTHLPSDVGAKGWLQGYSELPDVTWFWFDRQEIKIGPNGVGYANMFFEIPKQERYYNQHWVLALGIRGKAEAGPSILLATYPKIQLETESKDGVRVRPEGPFGLEPSILVIKKLRSASQNQATLSLYNNHVESRRYRLTSKTFPSLKGEPPPIPPSPGYQRIPNLGWIVPNSSRVRLGPRERVSVPLTITIPNDQVHRGKRWESILFVESEDGRTRFARVRIETEK